MTNDKGILIKNIYYMLSYAFQVLKQTNYEKVSAEEFDNTGDLFAAILAKGVAQQLKQGLHRQYVTEHDALSVMRGRLDMPETIRNKVQRSQKLACEFDELSENNLMNQILKTTMYYLSRDKAVSNEQKYALKKVMPFFDGIKLLDPATIKWNMLQYNRNNRSYEMLMNICYFVLEGMLQTTESGEYKVAAFSDEQMNMLYERFVAEYYRQEFPKLSVYHSKTIPWALDDGINAMLPQMKSDTMISYKDKVLIIDTKYYAHTTVTHYGKSTIHTQNLYQIYAYVKNKDAEFRDKPHTVSGMLLYARTEDLIQPDQTYRMGGNRIDVETLDLNKDFSDIRQQLDGIAVDFFGVKHSI